MQLTTDEVGLDQRRQMAVDLAMQFANRFRQVARRFRATARNLVLIGFSAALILDFIMQRHWQWGLPVSSLVGVLLLTPTMVVGWGWYVLEEAIGLPDRVGDWCDGASSCAATVVGRGEGDAARSKNGISDIKSLLNLAIEIATLGFDVGGLMSILGGALSIVNPLYLTALCIAVPLILTFGLFALILGFSQLF